MAGERDSGQLGKRILLGAVVVVLGGSMLLYRVPQTPGTGEAATHVDDKIGDQSVTHGERRQQLDTIAQRNQGTKPI